MKVCIVTVYNSTNCGSYLQAYALRYTLRQMGHEVCFLKTGVKHNRRIFFRKAIRSLKKGKFGQVRFDHRKLRNFEKALRDFPLCAMQAHSLSQQDVFVLGSDEIWNLSREDMRQAPVFWGCGLAPAAVISYAPSVNTTVQADVEKVDYVRQALADMRAISVRDSYSKALLSHYTDKEIQVLCDPTFLLPMEQYRAMAGTCPYDDFILIYSAGAKFTAEDQQAIRAFAGKKQKKLVAFPHNLAWCDEQAPADPLDAVAYFSKADYVITDTFHGAALSLIFGKDFLALPRGNTKVTELLEYFDVSQLMRENAEETAAYFDGIYYDKQALTVRIGQEREKAVAYLQKALGNAASE